MVEEKQERDAKKVKQDDVEVKDAKAVEVKQDVEAKKDAIEQVPKKDMIEQVSKKEVPKKDGAKQCKGSSLSALQALEVSHASLRCGQTVFTGPQCRPVPRGGLGSRAQAQSRGH